MDAQLKRGTIEVCVLAALIDGPSYGYKIVKDLENIMGLSESTLYPVLKRLESNHLVTTHTEECNGRLRKFYTITEDGYQKILEYLDDFKELMKVYRYIERKAKNEG